MSDEFRSWSWEIEVNAGKLVYQPRATNGEACHGNRRRFLRLKPHPSAPGRHFVKWVRKG